MINRFYKILLMIFATNALFLHTYKASAYSVLTHEAIIDVTWDKTIQPLLLKKYPGATEDQLKEAHAYAYGGAVAPDMGYYPYGVKLFTNLVHYVRSGDFVNALLDEANDINEYAFALGVLCHYCADRYGHPIGTNQCVAIMFPEDRAKFGSSVTYAEDPVSHIQMEFGFDVLQTARGNYASEKYHNFIGFKISQPVLERAFLKTYGLSLNDIFKDLPRTISSFRWVIKNLFPSLTRTAWSYKKKDIVKSTPGMTRRRFEYKMKTANYNHEFGKKHDRPGFFPGMLAAVIKILPKSGKLKDFKLKVPGPEAEKIFIQSFDTVQKHYVRILEKMPEKTSNFANIDYDTGENTSPGEYPLADETYNDFVLKLKGDNFKRASVSLRQNIVRFYGTCNEQIAARAGIDKWNQITAALDTLKALQPVN